jgi:hypothetical protein
MSSFPRASAIARNDLLAAVLYPDAADATDSVRFQFNLQSEVRQMQDQVGNANEYFRDLFLRITSDQAPVLGPKGKHGVRPKLDVSGLSA